MNNPSGNPFSLDLIDTERVSAVLRPLCSTANLNWIEEVDSTNKVLWDMARDGARSYTTIVADRQTSGKGRHQRNWASPPGGLYLSVLLRLSKEGAPLSLVPLMIGLALREAIIDEAQRRGVSIDVNLKWPNDLLTSNGKLAGILCETTDDDDNWLIIAGIGVNILPLGADNKRLITAETTSLYEEADADWTRSGLIVALMRRLIQRRQDWENKPEEIVQDWIHSSNIIGRKITVKTMKEEIEGTAVGLSEIGALKIRTSEGVIELSSAEGIEVHDE